MVFSEVATSQDALVDPLALYLVHFAYASHYYMLGLAVPLSITVLLNAIHYWIPSYFRLHFNSKNIRVRKTSGIQLLSA